MSQKVSIKIKNYLFISLGAVIYACGISLFLQPNHITSGGVSGISILLHEILPKIDTGTFIIILNIPIFCLGVYKFGLKFIVSTVYAVVLSSISMNFLSAYVSPFTQTPLLAVCAGQSLVALGIGIVFRAGGTTGGTDIVIKVLKTKIRHVDTGVFFLVIDGVIVALSGIVFNNIDLAIYAGIGVVLQSRILNMVLYSGNEARLVYIISKNKEEISDTLLQKIGCGVTYIKGKGAYTGNENDIIMCVMHMKTLPETRDIVKNIDKKAFMIVTSASSVFGEGFKPHDAEDL